ncbi:MAG: class I SAM-dependent DNA methyltransferase [Candidatus Thorarchaeota archaeon]|jgi:ubiquinone/menaquinone biosynthesis C-methylase UbiE
MKETKELWIYSDGRHYDSMLEVRDQAGSGFEFYQQQARKYQGPVLELACGTGRITIPLSHEVSITGLDFSKAMLDSARLKAKDKNLDIEFIHGDMTNFELNKKFNLILMTGIAFAHLETREDVEDCLSCVKRHLTDDGRFIFDFFNPSLAILTRNPSEQFPHAEYPDPDGNGMVTITESNKYDSAKQINKLQLHFKLGEREETHSVNMRMFFPQELDALLYYNGFEIEHKYGGYNGQPFDSDSGLQIVICKPR